MNFTEIVKQTFSELCSQMLDIFKSVDDLGFSDDLAKAVKIVFLYRMFKRFEPCFEPTIDELAIYVDKIEGRAI